MENLKVGDIKKFIIKNRELVGIIVTKYSNALEIACLDGDIREIEYIKQMQENNNFRYTAVRLDPKLRNRFELIAEELKKYYMIEKNIRSLEKKLEEMKKERNKQWGNVKNNINELPKIQGYIKPSDLLTVFNEKLKKAKPSLHRRLFPYEYNIENDVLLREKKYLYSMNRLDDTNGGVWLSFYRKTPIRHYYFPRPYDFILSYEPSRIDTESNHYKKLLSIFSLDDVSFSINPLKGKVEKNRGMDTYTGRESDYYSLVYYHYINIFVPYDCLTETYIDKLIDSITY